MKEKIKKILGSESWNGTTSQGKPFTQWVANDGFFQLWKESKDEIKKAGFSLYKDYSGDWLVTLWGVQEGHYTSEEDYLFAKRVARIKNLLLGGLFSDEERKNLLPELEKCKTTDDLDSFISKYSEKNPFLVTY